MAGSGLKCGELLRRHRLLVGLTQEELADRSGYSADYVGKLERGQRRPPAAAVRRIATILELSERELADLLAAREWVGAAESDVAPIAGRAAELAEIRRLLAGSGPAVLLFSGEPGVGKTRLLDEAAALATRCGWRVVRGGCRARAGDPYAPLTEAVADSLRGLSEGEQRAALSVAGRLDLLLPELRGQDGPGAVEESSGELGVPASVSEHERRLLFAAVNDYLLAVAGEAGTLLVVDDLQWAGRDALDLLAAVASADDRPGLLPARGGRLRVMGGYRDTRQAAASSIGEFVSELAGLSSAQVVSLGPLSDAESAELLRGRLPSAQVHPESVLSAVVRRAGGMPLFLVSFAEELDRRGDLAVELELPWSAAQVVRQRVAELPAQVQELLAVASVAAGAVQPELLCEASSRDMQEVLEALRVACDARLVTDEEDGCRFVHDLVRETIEQDLSAGWRRLWHARLAGALTRLSERRRRGRAAEIAWHLEHADDPEQAMPWMLRAGDEAAAAAGHAVAERRFTAATELARALGDERAEAEAAGKLADMLFRLARYEDALEPLERAAATLLGLDERDRYLTTVARSGEMYGLCGQAAEGIQRILPTLKALEDAGDRDSRSPGAADLYAAVCGLYLNVGQLGDVLETAEVAVSLSEQTGNLRAACTAELMRALALGALNRRSDQLLAHERAADAAGRLGDPWILAGVLASQGSAHIEGGDLADGELLIRRALELAERAGLSGPAALTRSKLADLLVSRGHWGDAREEAERALGDSQPLGGRPGHTYVLVSLGRILLLAGERDEGLRRLQDALALTIELGYRPGIFIANELLAWQEVRDGDPDVAIARLEPLVQARHRAGRPWYPTAFAWAHLEAGNEQDAASVLASARALSAAESHVEAPELLLQCAKLAVRQNRLDDATRDLEAGLAGARAIGLPYEQALLLEEYAWLYAAQGERGKAREPIAQAAAIFDRLGAVPDAARAREAKFALFSDRNENPASAPS
jgi:transcriptional regulator with XRE-family HTH domain/tetratricopeptide (TPR) repeat protein